MAKTSSVEKNNRRRKLVAQNAAKRRALKAIIMDHKQPLEERFQAQLKLAAMPRNGSKTRIRNRCEVTGRPRAFYRKLKLSRVALRELPTGLLLGAGLGIIGFIDDFLKTRKQRSLGLGGWSKIAGQVIVAGGFAALALNFPDQYGLTPASSMISAVRDIHWLNLAAFGAVAGGILFAIWVTLIIVSASNGVNVADGLDGLAIVPGMIAAASFGVIAYLSGNAVFADPHTVRIEDVPGRNVRNVTAAHIVIATGTQATRDGRISGCDFRGTFNTGAYAPWGPTVANRQIQSEVVRRGPCTEHFSIGGHEHIGRGESPGSCALFQAAPL